MNANGGANGGAGGGDDQTPEERHRAHVREMDKLRAREQVCYLFLHLAKVFIKVKTFTLNFLGGKGNFECYSPPKRIK